jgi:hypothetical protein
MNMNFKKNLQDTNTSLTKSSLSHTLGSVNEIANYHWPLGQLLVNRNFQVIQCQVLQHLLQ